MCKNHFRNRVTAITLFFTILISTAVCQQSVKFINGIKTNLPYFENNQFSIKSKMYGNKMYSMFIDNFDIYVTNNLSLRFDEVDLKTHKSNLYTINFLTKNKKIDEVKKSNTTVTDFIIENSYLYVLTYNYIIKFELLGNEYRIKEIIKIKDGYKSLFISNYSHSQAIIADHSIYNKTASVFAAKINLHNGKVKNVIKPIFKGIGFSYYSSNWWNFSEHYFLLGGNLEYKVNIYDKETLKQTDSIVYKKKGFEQNLSRIDSFTYYDKSSIGLLLEYDKVYNRIFNSFFINDSTILLVINKAEEKYKYLDLWRKMDGTWKLVIEDGKINNKQIEDSTICINNNFIFAGLANSNPSVFWNNLLVTKSRLYFNIDFFIGKSYHFFGQCIKREIKSEEIESNVDYNHSAIFTYEISKP